MTKLGHLAAQALHYVQGTQKAYENVRPTSSGLINLASVHNVTSTITTTRTSNSQAAGSNTDASMQPRKTIDDPQNTNGLPISTPTGEAPKNDRRSIPHQRILENLTKIRNDTHAKFDEANKTIYPDLFASLNELSNTVDKELKDE